MEESKKSKKDEYVLTAYCVDGKPFHIDTGADVQELLSKCAEILADPDVVRGLKTVVGTNTIDIIVERKCPCCGRFEKVKQLTEFI